MEAFAAQIWDVVVIGTGIGGGVIGRRLAEAGLSVLFLEKGPLEGSDRPLNAPEVRDPATRQDQGLWPKPAVATIDGRTSEFFTSLGATVGGTSIFYAAVLERPERHDLDHHEERPHPTGGWAVGYDQFKPYYEAAESLFEVCGTHDPLSPEPHPTLRNPPELPDQDRVMAESFGLQGLHPYQIHVGSRFLSGCENCFGFRCRRKCKLDGRSAGVDPALETGNAALLDECEVQAIHATASGVSHVQASRRGQGLQLRARTYVLAAGGLGSPKLLLASQNEAWPNGIGNQNDLVGRYLMFHLMELVAIWPTKGHRSPGPSKALAFRDFYFTEGQRFGIVQAMGVDASYGMIVQYLNGLFDRSSLRKLKPLRAFSRVIAYVAEKLFGSAKVFSATIEDLPYRDNRVTLDPDDIEKLRFDYKVPQELHDRRVRFRRIVKHGIRGHRMAFLSITPQLNFPHSCGTLRFGEEPQTSVLDPDCRVHGLDNLYVTDSSFMPTSLGINPSLTIAANALRVADRILASQPASVLKASNTCSR